MIIGLFLGASSPASADVYMETRVAAAGTTKTWISGLKKKEDTAIAPEGRRITIIRLDKGVEWRLDPERREYEERPIALRRRLNDLEKIQPKVSIENTEKTAPPVLAEAAPPPPKPTTKEMAKSPSDAFPSAASSKPGPPLREWSSTDAHSSMTGAMPPSPPDAVTPAAGKPGPSLPGPSSSRCTFQIKALAVRREIAGFPVTGYRSGCAEKPAEGTIFWTAAGPTVAPVQLEIRHFALAYFNARLKGYRTIPVGAGKAEAGGEEASSMPKQGMVMAVDNCTLLQTTRIREIVQISTAPVSAGEFALPRGYRKVAHLKTSH